MPEMAMIIHPSNIGESTPASVWQDGMILQWTERMVPDKVLNRTRGDNAGQKHQKTSDAALGEAASKGVYKAGKRPKEPDQP